MDVRNSLAAQSYMRAQANLKPQPADPAAEGVGGSLQKFATDFAETLREGEATAKAGLVGKADAHSVVEALASTELAVETAVTVRNKVVEAYQEILRMPV